MVRMQTSLVQTSSREAAYPAFQDESWHDHNTFSATFGYKVMSILYQWVDLVGGIDSSPNIGALEITTTAIVYTNTLRGKNSCQR